MGLGRTICLLSGLGLPMVVACPGILFRGAGFGVGFFGHDVSLNSDYFDNRRYSVFLALPPGQRF